MISVDLTNPRTIAELCSRYGFKFKKSLGQNFLIDKGWAKAISKMPCCERVVEIGPGLGSLTQHVLETRRCVDRSQVVVIERDPVLCHALSEIFADDISKGFLEIVNDDALKIEFGEFSIKHFYGLPFSVISNLPYNITTPLVTKLLEELSPLSDLTLTMQKEVAERLMAVPGTKAYGALTVYREYYAEMEEVAELPPTIFMPMPKVRSSVVKLAKRVSIMEQNHRWTVTAKQFFRVVRGAFGQRRKTIANALSNAGVASKDEVVAILDLMGLPIDVRGEKLSISEFGMIAQALYTKLTP